MFAEGNVLAWEATGLVSGKKWATAGDDLVCGICFPLNGKVVEIEGNFELLPGEMSDDLLARAMEGEEFTWQTPPAHPRCRCWLQPFVTEMDIERRVQEVLV